MANTVTGKVLKIGPVREITAKSGKTIKKRELILDATRFDPYTGERGFENYPSFEFVQDKIADLDGLKAGQVVTVSFDLQGTRYEKDGEERYFTSVRGFKVEARAVQAPAPLPPASALTHDDLPF